jgi:hypothetical protein
MVFFFHQTNKDPPSMLKAGLFWILFIISLRHAFGDHVAECAQVLGENADTFG